MSPDQSLVFCILLLITKSLALGAPHWDLKYSDPSMPITVLYCTVTLFKYCIQLPLAGRWPTSLLALCIWIFEERMS